MSAAASHSTGKTPTHAVQATPARRLALLEGLYRRLNRPEMIDPDPLAIVREFGDPRDREIVALIGSCLAYGNVVTIMASIRDVLGRMAGGPHRYLTKASPKRLHDDFADFRHRVTSGPEMAFLLQGAREAIAEHGSLGAAFEQGISADEPSLMPALERFVAILRRPHGGAAWHLLPSPASGSACKRMNMLLRWMVRRDAVDPGGWAEGMAPGLVMPVDTHMFHTARAMGLTQRKTADLKAALEITEAFRRFRPDDPVRYDFALTRLGIRDELTPDQFLDQWRAD
ncbi:MAG: TIGR02757 family protein [Armatimonadia bacterium]|nr:TIGR02757 family protein [Armatimonadia bacterium]